MERQVLSKKKIILNCIIIAIVTIIAIFYLAKENIFSDLSSIKEIPLYAYLIIGLIVSGYVLCDSFIISTS